MPSQQKTNRIFTALLILAFVVGQWVPTHIHMTDVESHEISHHHDVFRHAHTIDIPDVAGHSHALVTEHVVDLSSELLTSERDKKHQVPDFLTGTNFVFELNRYDNALKPRVQTNPPPNRFRYLPNTPRAPPTVTS